MYLSAPGNNYVRTKHTPVSQNVVKNKKDYEVITQKLETIITIAQKYQQHGCQRALDRRIEDLSTCVVFIMLHGFSGAYVCLSAVNGHTEKIQRLQARWLIRRAFDNDEDAALVAKSFRDIGVLLNVFHVTILDYWMK